MNYISTRNKSLNFDFSSIFLRGLAPDGGLFLPNEIIKFSESELKELRQEYVKIVNQINSEFNDITAKIGGETGIDVYPTGCDKSQVINEFNGFDNLIFFGDKMEEGGNDEPLAKAIKNRGNGKSYHVRDWKHTWEILKDYA